MIRREVYDRLNGERSYQELMTKTKGWQQEHSVGDWIVFMQGYLNKAIARGSKEIGWDGALDELRKVAALAVACFEEHGVPERKSVDQK